MIPTNIDPSSSPPIPTTDATKLVELIRDVRVAMLTTFPDAATSPIADSSGGMHTRPMYTQKLDPPHASSPNRFDGHLWFMTDDASQKLRELADEQRVLITYADEGKNIYAAVYGRASAERNPQKARELWNIHAKGWWPGGPEDPRLMLIRVAVDAAEYWDGPSNTSYLLNLFKAVATGERVQIKSEHGQLQT